MGDTDRLVTLTCPNHCQILVNGLWSCLTNKRSVDIDIHWSAGHSIKAHRLVLDLFLSVEKLVTKADGTTTAAQTDAGMANSFLEFLYKGEVTVREMQLESLLQVAKELDFHALADAVVATSQIGLAEPAQLHQRSHSKTQSTKNQQRNSNCISKRLRRTTPASKKPNRRTRKRRSEAPSKEAQASPLQTDTRTSSPSSVTDNVINNHGGDTNQPSPPLSNNPETSGLVTTKTNTNISGLSDRAPRFSCSHCTYTTRAKIGLRVHQAKHDANITILRCDSCNRPFFSRESLDRHRQSSHGDSTVTHACQRCDYRTPKLANFYQHLYSRHHVNARGQPIEPKFKCPDCEFVCAIRSKLRLHLDKHATAKPFRCDQCTFSSKRKGDLVQHVRTIHLDIRRFVCETCGHRSPSLAVLELHRRTHSGERPFLCGSCDKAFADPAAFSRHVRLHGANEKPYVCHVCGFPFNRRGNLRAHLKNVHKIQMDPDNGVARARRNWTDRNRPPNRI